MTPGQSGPLHAFRKHLGSICAVCTLLRDSGVVVLTAGEDVFIRIMDLLSGELERRIHSGHTMRIKSMRTHNDTFSRSIRILTSGLDGLIRVTNYETGDNVFVLRGHIGAIGGMELFCWDKFTFCVSGGYDFSVRVWDLQEGDDSTAACCCNETKHDDWVTSIATCRHNDQSYVISGSSDWSIIVWELSLFMASGTANLTCLHRLREHLGAVLSVIIIPGKDQKSLSDKLSDISSIPTFKNDLPITIDKSNMTTMSSPRIVSAGTDRIIRISLLLSGQLLAQFEGHTSFVRYVSYLSSFTGSSCGVLLSCGEDCSIRIWDISTQTELWILEGNSDTVRDFCVVSVPTVSSPTQFITELGSIRTHVESERTADVTNVTVVTVTSAQSESVSPVAGQSNPIPAPAPLSAPIETQLTLGRMLVSVAWNGMTMVFDLDAVERELRWRRRRNFVIFISRLKLNVTDDMNAMSMGTLPAQDRRRESMWNVMWSEWVLDVFQSVILCKLICSFL